MTGNTSSLGEVAKPILFHGVKASCNVLLRGRRGTSWHSHVSANVLKILLYGRHNTFASFSEDELQFRGRLQHFETSIVISRGRHSTLDVSCRVCFRIAFSGLRQAATRCKVRGGRGLLWDVLKIDGSLARNISFQVASSGVHQKTRRKNVDFEGTCRNKVWKLEEVSHEMLVLMLQRVWSRVSGFLLASPCLWGKLQNLSCFTVSKRVVMCFCVAGVALRDILMCLQTCRKSFCMAGTILLRRFQKMSCSFVAGCNTLRHPSSFRVAGAALQSCRVACSTLQTPHFTLYTSDFTLYTPHSTLHTLHCTLSTPHFTLHTLHFTLPTLHFTLHTLHFTLHTLHFTLHTAHFTLYAPHFALYTLHSALHTLHSTLYTLYSTAPAHFTLYTLRSTLHTPHFTLYSLYFNIHTIHSTLYTLQLTLNTLHFTLYTPHSTQDTPHFTLFSPHFTLCTLHLTLHTLHFTLNLHTPHFTLHTFNFTLYTPHSTLYTPHSTLHTSHFTLRTRHCTLYTLHSTLQTLHSTLYTLHSTLYTLHSTLHTLHLTLYTSHSTLFTLHTPHSTLHIPHFTLYALLSTLYTPHSSLHTPHPTPHIPHFTLYTLLSTLYTLHSTLCIPPSSALHSVQCTGAVTGEDVQDCSSQKCPTWLHSGSWVASCFWVRVFCLHCSKMYYYT